MTKLRYLVHVHESPLIACDPKRGESAFAKPPLNSPPSHSRQPGRFIKGLDAWHRRQ